MLLFIKAPTIAAQPMSPIKIHPEGAFERGAAYFRGHISRLTPTKLKRELH